MFLIVVWAGGRPRPRFRSRASRRAIAFDIHLQDRGVVDEAVDGGERHGLVGENFAPFAEGLVGRNEQDRRS